MAGESVTVAMVMAHRNAQVSSRQDTTDNTGTGTWFIVVFGDGSS
jgi:hypothetical protein